MFNSFKRLKKQQSSESKESLEDEQSTRPAKSNAYKTENQPNTPNIIDEHEGRLLPPAWVRRAIDDKTSIEDVVSLHVAANEYHNLGDHAAAIERYPAVEIGYETIDIDPGILANNLTDLHNRLADSYYNLGNEAHLKGSELLRAHNNDKEKIALGIEYLGEAKGLYIQAIETHDRGTSKGVQPNEQFRRVIETNIEGISNELPGWENKLNDSDDKTSIEDVVSLHVAANEYHNLGDHAAAIERYPAVEIGYETIDIDPGILANNLTDLHNRLADSYYNLGNEAHLKGSELLRAHNNDKEKIALGIEYLGEAKGLYIQAIETHDRGTSKGVQPNEQFRRVIETNIEGISNELPGWENQLENGQLP